MSTLKRQSGGHIEDGNAMVVTVSKHSVTHTHEKEKHGSFFSRVGSKHGDVSDEQAQRVGYSRAKKVCIFCVGKFVSH